MKKATISSYYVRECYGNVAEVINARQEISRGNRSYGVNWKFAEVSKETFLKLIEGYTGYIETINDSEMKIEYPMFCVQTQSGKFIEVDKNDIGKFANL